MIDGATQAETATINLDGAVLEVIPYGQKVVSVKPHGSSSWASTMRVDVQCSDHSRHSYFLKFVRSEDAADRVLGEFKSMEKIHESLNSISPKPLSFGKCLDEHGCYFFICDYLNFRQQPPDPVALGAKLARLHKESRSPTGQFGFGYTTFDGKLPLNTTWNSSWTSFFSTLLYGVYQLDVQVNGPWTELDDVMRTTVEKLIPRLIGAVESEGRSVKPCLIHGGLWEANIGTDAETDEIYIFDACAYYAHHEKEMGIWRVEHHEMKQGQYRAEYFKNYPPSEPRGEFDDRNRLYAVETLLINSAHSPGATTRKLALEDMKYLIQKYVNKA